MSNEKSPLLDRVKLYRKHLNEEVQEMRTRGGTMAMKHGHRVRLLDEVIEYIEQTEK